MARRAFAAIALPLLVGSFVLSQGEAGAAMWASFNASASASAARVIVAAPGGPFAGPNDRIADVTVFAAEAQTNELNSNARGSAAFHGNEGAIPGARGLAPTKLDEALAPTPIGGLPITPPATLPLEARAVHPTTPRADAKAPTVHSAASADATNASATITSGAARAESSVGVASDGAVRATAHSAISGVTIGPVSIARVESTATAATRDGAVVRFSSLDVVGLRIGETEVAFVPDLDKTVGSVRVWVRNARTDSAGVRAAVLEVVIPLPTNPLSTGASAASFVFGGAEAHVDGTIDDEELLVDSSDEVGVLDDVLTLGDTAWSDGAVDFAYDTATPDSARAVGAGARRRRDVADGADGKVLGIAAATLMGMGAAGAAAWHRRSRRVSV